jgi:hypothetical protein
LAASLLDEDRALFEQDVRRYEAAQAGLEQLWQSAAGLLAQVAADERKDAERFLSDDTLVRYLITCDGDEGKALNMIKATMNWRATAFKGLDTFSTAHDRTVCPCCLRHPLEHCFFQIGTDCLGRSVIYACAGRATNKNCDDGMMHIALEIDRIFQGNSVPGQAVLVIDFNGFGLADCHPRAGLLAVPLFSNHYAERFAQFVMLGVPALAEGMLYVFMKAVDSVTRRRVVMLRGAAPRQRYMDAYWSSDPAMFQWMQDVMQRKGTPGNYPDIALSRALQEPCTVDLLERCEVVRQKVGSGV